MCFVQEGRGQDQILSDFARVAEHPNPGWVAWDTGSCEACSGHSVRVCGRMNPDYFLPQIPQRKKPILDVNVFEIVDEP